MFFPTKKVKVKESVKNNSKFSGGNHNCLQIFAKLANLPDDNSNDIEEKVTCCKARNVVLIRKIKLNVA